MFSSLYKISTFHGAPQLLGADRLAKGPGDLQSEGARQVAGGLAQAVVVAAQEHHLAAETLAGGGLQEFDAIHFG